MEKYEKVSKLFDFLKSEDNRKFNQIIQNGVYRGRIIQYTKSKERIISLLYEILNTQSQPKLDNCLKFWEKVYKVENSNCFNSLDNFIKMLSEEPVKNNNTSIDNTNGKLERLFQALTNQPGWGDKTAALFVKSCCRIHWDDSNKDLRFWSEDFPTENELEKIYLPVDSVIRFIFKELNVPIKQNFKEINRYIHEHYKQVNDLLIWDDLWFWGFITQNSQTSADKESKNTDDARKLEWNRSKYYSIFHAPKDENTIEQVQSRAEQFIKLIKAEA